MLPELVTLAKPVAALIPYPPVMLAPVLLVTVAFVQAIMPKPEVVVPVMLPELVTSAKVLATIPLRPPVMLAPALLVTVALV